MKLETIGAGTVLALFVATASYAQPSSHAKADPRGCYVAKSGYASSSSIPPDGSEQIGSYRIVLSKKTGAMRTRQLVLSGPFKGRIISQDPLLLEHVLGDANLDGLILTQNDQGQITGGTGTMLQVSEVLKPVAGSGKFLGLIAGGTITVIGTLDSTTGTNTFEVVPNAGQVCFE